MTSADGTSRYFYLEMFPYSNLLSTWVMVTQIDTQVISAPFQQIRWVIWLCAAIALLISLMLANVGTMRVSNPISELTHKLLDYANGHYQAAYKPARASMRSMRWPMPSTIWPTPLKKASRAVNGPRI